MNKNIKVRGDYMDIREYLLKQKSLSNELNDILLKLNDLDVEEREKIALENKDLIQEIDKINEKNISTTKDRIEILKMKIIKLVNLEENKNNLEYCEYLKKTYNDLIKIEKKVKEINDSLELAKVSNNENVLKTQTKVELEKNIPLIDSKKKVEVKREEDSSKRKFEFNLGVNILSIIGVILILISFVTFGRFVYVNYMNNFMKGISLFIISIAILGLGEFLHKKIKNPVSIGIISLGVAALFSSVIINYLSLRTINSIVALIITLTVTIISMLISNKYSSNIIRAISLAGGYICLSPMNTLNEIQSITTVIILCAIGIFNILNPIKNEKEKIPFNIYSIILSLIVYVKIISQGFLDDKALIIYSIVNCIIINIMFLREGNSLEESKVSYKKIRIIALYFIFSIIIVNFRDIEMTYSIIIYSFYLLILVLLFIKGKNTKWLFYIQFIITAIYMSAIFENNNLLTGVVVILTLTSLYLFFKNNNIFINAALWICIGSSIADYFSKFDYLETILCRLIYVVIFALAIFILALKNKNNILLIILKYFYIILFFVFINSLEILNGFTNKVLIFLTINIIFTVISYEFEILRHKDIELHNFILLIITGFLNIISLNILNINIIQFIIIVVLGISNILLLNKSDNKSYIVKNNYLILGIYLALVILRLSNLRVFPSLIGTIIGDILLMMLSLACIWAGFKIKIKNIRKYGLILALLTCGKVVFVDLYIRNFIIKTILFLLTGCIALLISYAYTKIEKKQ